MRGNQLRLTFATFADDLLRQVGRRAPPHDPVLKVAAASPSGNCIAFTSVYPLAAVR